jgi:protein arginine N-methyltransferase 3
MKGKKVIDVGCGTGILSLFACRAGASQVFSIEGSERMAKFARDVCKKNGFDSQGGGPMTVLTSKVEDLQTLPTHQATVSVDGAKADVLVSEWMGYALLFETMLDSVLYARDHLLKPQGAILPDLAHIIIAGAGPKSTESSFWKDVYGFDMSPIAEEVVKSEVGKALVHSVDAADLVTESVRVKTLDLVTMKAEDQDFSSAFTLSSPSESSSVSTCSSVVIWFDTEFSSRFCMEFPVVLSTSVASQTTHWVQTVLVLEEPVPLMGRGGASAGVKAAPCINGRLSMVRDKRKHRSLDISLEYKAELSDGTVIQKTTLYTMSVKD